MTTDANQIATPLFVLDQSDDGEWMVWDKDCDEKHRMGFNKQRVVHLLSSLNAAHRPNVERSPYGGMMVCWNHHDKGEPCEYEFISRIPLSGDAA